MTDTEIKFQPGTVVATVGALSVAEQYQVQIAKLLARHLSGDWGDLGPEDKRANEHALKHDERLFSSYEIAPDTKLWVITEFDQSATTVLTPDEY